MFFALVLGLLLQRYSPLIQRDIPRNKFLETLNLFSQPKKKLNNICLPSNAAESVQFL